jgi:hypothetical protein
MVDVAKTKFKGIVSPIDKEFTVTITDKFTGKQVIQAVSEKGTGKYSIDLAPGRYIFKTEADGFITITEDIPVLGKSTFKELIIKDINMVEGTNPPPPAPGTVKPK